MRLAIPPRRVRSATGLAVLALLMSLNAARSNSARLAEDPVQAIRAVLRQQQADWNKGDLDAFLTGYWKSPRVVFQSGGNRYDGWEAMRDRYRKRYKAEGKAMGEVSFSAIDIEMLSTEAALVRGARADPARRFEARRTFHPDFPEVPRRLEDRARPYFSRGTKQVVSWWASSRAGIFWAQLIGLSVGLVLPTGLSSSGVV